MRALFLNLGCERLDTLVRRRPIEIAQQGGKGVQREGRALTPSNDEPDCRIRAADDEERREVPHVVIVCDGEQHPIDITSWSVQRRIGTDWPQRSNKAFFFFFEMGHLQISGSAHRARDHDEKSAGEEAVGQPGGDCDNDSCDSIGWYGE